MKKSKRLISSFMAVVMILTCLPSYVFSVDSVVRKAKFNKNDVTVKTFNELKSEKPAWQVSTAGTTEVVRLGTNGSYSYGNEIVTTNATGVPITGATNEAVALMGDTTPVEPKVVFSLTGTKEGFWDHFYGVTSPKKYLCTGSESYANSQAYGLTLNLTQVGEPVTTTNEDNITKTWTWTLPIGSTIGTLTDGKSDAVGKNIVYDIDYKVGYSQSSYTTYTAHAYAHVENIYRQSGYVDALSYKRRYHSTCGVYGFIAVSAQNAYPGWISAEVDKDYVGYYNYHSTANSMQKFSNGETQVLDGCHDAKPGTSGSEFNVADSTNGTTLIHGDTAGTVTDNKGWNLSVATNIASTTIYVDSSEEHLGNGTLNGKKGLNLRLTYTPTQRRFYQYVESAQLTADVTNYTSTTYSTTVSGITVDTTNVKANAKSGDSQLTKLPDDSDFSNLASVTKMIQLSGTADGLCGGNMSGTENLVYKSIWCGADDGGISDEKHAYAINYFLFSFKKYNAYDLRNLVEGISYGKISATTNNSGETVGYNSKTNLYYYKASSNMGYAASDVVTTTFKVANPEKYMFNCTDQQWTNFQNALTWAGCVLAAPDSISGDSKQNEVNGAYTELRSTYEALGEPIKSYNVTVKYMCEDEPIFIDEEATVVYTLPVGSLYKVVEATFAGFTSLQTESAKSVQGILMGDTVITFNYERNTYSLAYVPAYYTDYPNASYPKTQFISIPYLDTIDDYFEAGTYDHHTYVGLSTEGSIINLKNSGVTNTSANEIDPGDFIMPMTNECVVYGNWQVKNVRVMVVPSIGDPFYIDDTYEPKLLGEVEEQWDEKSGKTIAEGNQDKYLYKYNEDTYRDGIPESVTVDNATVSSYVKSSFTVGENEYELKGLYDSDGNILSWPLTVKYDDTNKENPAGISVETNADGEDYIKVYANYVKLNGKIYLEPNNGTVTGDTELTCESGVAIPAPVVAREGYDFDGWYTTSTFDEGTRITAWDTGSYIPTSSKGFTAYAKWNAQTHYIRFQVNKPSGAGDYSFNSKDSLDADGNAYSGTGTAYYAVVSGKTDQAFDLSSASVPALFGYNFAYWSLNGRQPLATPITKIPASDVTLKAVWTSWDYSSYIDLKAYEKLEGDEDVAVGTTYKDVDEGIRLAQKGDVVTVKLMANTSFYTGDSEYMVMYDANFFEPYIPSQDSSIDGNSVMFANLNPEHQYVKDTNATLDYNCNISAAAQSYYWPTAISDLRTTEGYKVVLINVAGDKDTKSQKLTDTKWLVEMRFKIKSTATGSGTIYMSEEWNGVKTPVTARTYFGAAVEQVQNSSGNFIYTIANPMLDLAATTVYLKSDTKSNTTINVNINQNDSGSSTIYTPAIPQYDASGSLITGGTPVYKFDSNGNATFTGPIGTEIYTFPAPYREGYTLQNYWRKASMDAQGNITVLVDTSAEGYDFEHAADNGDVWFGGYYANAAQAQQCQNGYIYIPTWEADEYTVKFYQGDGQTLITSDKWGYGNGTNQNTEIVKYDSAVPNPGKPSSIGSDANQWEFSCWIDMATGEKYTQEDFSEGKVICHGDMNFKAEYIGKAVGITLKGYFPTKVTNEGETTTVNMPVTEEITLKAALIKAIATEDGNKTEIARYGSYYKIVNEIPAEREANTYYMVLSELLAALETGTYNGSTAIRTTYKNGVDTGKTTVKSKDFYNCIFEDDGETVKEDEGYIYSIDSSLPGNALLATTGMPVNDSALLVSTQANNTVTFELKLTMVTITFDPGTASFPAGTELTDGKLVKVLKKNSVINPLPEVTVSYGSYFAGWYAGTTKLTVAKGQASDETYTAKITPANVNLKFLKEDKTSLKNITGKTFGTELTFGTDITFTTANINSLKKTGYTFDGWQVCKSASDDKYTIVDTTVYKDNDKFTISNLGDYTTAATGVITGNLYFLPHYTINSYEYSFDANEAKYSMPEGTVKNMPEGGTKDYNSVITKPSDPEADGFKFLGWTTSATGTTKNPFEDEETGKIKDYILTGDVTFYAVWGVDQKDVTVDIYLENENGEYVKDNTLSGVNKVSGAIGSKVSYTPNKTNDLGDKASLYKLNATKGSYTDITVPATDSEIVATVYYERESFNYTVNYYREKVDDAGKYALATADIVTTGSGKWGTTATVTPSNYANIGAGFKALSGNKGAALSGTIVASTTSPLVINVYLERESYTLKYVLNNGSNDETSQVKYGYTITPHATPEKAGYTFKDWTVTGSTSEPAAMPANAVTLSANYDINQYTITFDVDGGEALDQITQDYNTEVQEQSTTKPGYDLEGWYIDTEKVTWPYTITADVTMKANWTKHTYSDKDGIVVFVTPNTPEDTASEVTFPTDAKDYVALEGSIYEIAYDDLITFPQEGPSIEFFKFTGWKTADGSDATVVYKNMPAIEDNEKIYIFPAYERIPVTLLKENELQKEEKSNAKIKPEEIHKETYLDKEIPTAYIYNLDEGTTKDELVSQLKVEGNGELVITSYYELTYSANYDRLGTGSTVAVKDKVTGEILELYYIVIFGDMNGDGYCNSTDAKLLKSAVSSASAMTEEQKRAVECDGDATGVTLNDYKLILKVIAGSKTYDRADGQIK